MKELTLATQPRELGKGPAGRTRRAGGIPAVIYGHGDAPQHVAVAAAELERALLPGQPRILHLKMGRHQEAVFIKDVMRDPVSGRAVHADFQRVRLTERVRAEVAISAVGEDELGRRALVLSHHLHNVEVEGPAQAIPERLAVDVAALSDGAHFTVKDLVLPKDVKALTDAHEVLFSVHATQLQESEAAAEAE